MQATVALIGRRNVGKSTLFNALTRTRQALVADYPGLTRDRQYGRCVVGEHSFQLVDTGGAHNPLDETEERVEHQLSLALAEAGLLLLVVDARAGMEHADEDLARRVRRSGTPWILVINKVDGLDAEHARAEFAPMGAPCHLPVSATHKIAVPRLAELIIKTLTNTGSPRSLQSEVRPQGAIALAIVGRPNTGKSTLFNYLLKEERVVVSAQAGVTRDSIHAPCTLYGTDYLLIDTAGMRRRRFLHGQVEKFSTDQALKALKEAELAVLMIDATEGWVSQDAQLLDIAMCSGCATVIAANKWDSLTSAQMRSVRSRIQHGLRNARYVPCVELSARRGTGVRKLFTRLARMHQVATTPARTAHVNQVLRAAVEAHPPPLRMGRRSKLRYAHNSGTLPTVIVIYGSRVERVGANYRSYLERAYRDALGLEGVPIKLVFRNTANPYRGSARS